MFDPKNFTVPKAKPLPILLLLDVSGSMYGAKIDTLNQAVRTMLSDFAEEEKNETEIIVSIITFGEALTRLFPFIPASQVKFEDLSARGGTPLGKTLEMAKSMIEDKEETPSRAYRPTVVLVSDGYPGDDWRPPLVAFVSQGRSAKCDRMAMAIGKDADRNVLGKFVEGTPNALFEAHQAQEIYTFFQKVTMSVTTRSRSQDPNQISGSFFAAVDSSEANNSQSPISYGVPLDASSVQPSAEPGKEGADDDDDCYF